MLNLGSYFSGSWGTRPLTWFLTCCTFEFCWLCLLVRAWEQAEFLWTHNLRNLHSELYKWVHFLETSWNMSQLYNCRCFDFIPQSWSNGLLQWFTLWETFTILWKRKKLRNILSQIPFFIKYPELKIKYFFARNHHNWLHRRESSLRRFYTLGFWSPNLTKERGD